VFSCQEDKTLLLKFIPFSFKVIVSIAGVILLPRPTPVSVQSFYYIASIK